jgi:hypothetical protein
MTSTLFVFLFASPSPRRRARHVDAALSSIVVCCQGVCCCLDDNNKSRFIGRLPPHHTTYRNLSQLQPTYIAPLQLHFLLVKGIPFGAAPKMSGNNIPRQPAKRVGGQRRRLSRLPPSGVPRSRTLPVLHGDPGSGSAGPGVGQEPPPQEGATATHHEEGAPSLEASQSMMNFCKLPFKSVT